MEYLLIIAQQWKFKMMNLRIGKVSWEVRNEGKYASGYEHKRLKFM